MCSNKSLFQYFTQLAKPHFAGLLDGHDTPVTFVGDVKLHDSVILHVVLYVPSFKYNRVSVTKLSSQLKSFVLFIDKYFLL